MQSVTRTLARILVHGHTQSRKKKSLHDGWWQKAAFAQPCVETEYFTGLIQPFLQIMSSASGKKYQFDLVSRRREKQKPSIVVEMNAWLASVMPIVSQPSSLAGPTSLLQTM